MDYRLNLIAGTDLPVPECQLAIHQPTIRELSYIGEETFRIGAQYLCVNKNMLTEDESDLLNQSNFQIFMTIMASPEAKDKKDQVLELLKLLLPNHNCMLTPRSILCSSGGATFMIDDSNFEPFQEAISEVFCLRSGMNDQQTFNPQSEKAKEIAKKIAEDEKKTLQDVEKTAKDTFKKVFEAYVELLNDIKNVQSAVSGDYDAWSTVFGTDPKKIEQKLLGTYKGVIAYATEEAAKAFNESIAALDEDKIKEDLAKRFGKTFGEVTEQELVTEFNKIQKEIAEEYYNTLKDLGHNLEPFDKLFKFDKTKIDRLVAYIPEQVAKAFDDTGRSISANFTNQFNSLERLLNDGIIDYGDYYDTLLKMQKKYTEDYKANLEEGKAALKKALDDKKISQEEYKNRVLQLEYEMRLKPKEFQERVNEAIISGYKIKSEEALAILQKAIDDADDKLAKFESGYITWWDRISTPIWKYFKTQNTALEDTRKAQKKAYEDRIAEIDKLLDSESISEEQRELLEKERRDLEEAYTRIKEEGVAKRKSLQQAEFDYTIDSLNQTFSAMEGLFSGLNNLSKARMEVLDNQLAEEKITKKEYDKLKKQEIEKQAAMQKGVAIMQTAAGITSALATAMQLGFPVGPIVGAITAAALGVSLAAQLKSINAAKEAALRGNDSATTSTPDTTFTLTSPDAYQNTLSDEVQTDLQANAKDNQRVYVVSSDISNAQNNEKTTVTTATF